METDEKDPSVIPEDIKEFVRAAHKAQRESRPDEAWRIQRAQKQDAVAAPYKQDEDSEETGAQPMMGDSDLKMARGGVVLGYADGAYPDMDDVNSEIAPQGTGMLTPAMTPPPAPAQPIIPDLPAAPPPPPAAPPVVKQPVDVPDTSSAIAPTKTDADYAAQAAKMLGTEPSQQTDLLKALGQYQRNASIGTDIAGLGDAIAAGGTLGKVNLGGAQRSQDLIASRTAQTLEGAKTLQENKGKTTDLALKLESQDPNSPLSKYAQKAYGDVGKKLGINLSKAPASLIADITGKGVSELNDEAELAVRKEGLDIQKGQLSQTIENNKAQRLHDEAVLAETAKDRERTQADTEAAHQAEAAKTLGGRGLLATGASILTPSGRLANRVLAAQASGAKSFDSVEQAESAGLPKGTRVSIGGRMATIQ